MLIIYGLYLNWTAVGKDVAVGVQGRYMIPIFILPLLTLCGKERFIKINNPMLICSIILVFIHYNTICTIISFFL